MTSSESQLQSSSQSQQKSSMSAGTLSYGEHGQAAIAIAKVQSSERDHSQITSSLLQDFNDHMIILEYPSNRKKKCIRGRVNNNWGECKDC